MAREPRTENPEPGPPAVLSGTTLIVSPHPGPGRARTFEPITVGVPLPRGVVRDPHRIGLVGHGQAMVPLQALPTERWPDGSIRWVLLDFQATGPATSDRRYQLELDCPAPQCRRRVWRSAETADGSWSTLARRCSGCRPAPASRSRRSSSAATPRSTPRAAHSSSSTPGGNRGAPASRRSRSRTADRCDRAFGSTHSSAHRAGRCSRSSHGSTSSRGRRRRGSRSPSAIHAELATREGPGSLAIAAPCYLRDASLHLALPSSVTALDCTPELGLASRRSSLPFELYQDSSGGEQWRHPDSCEPAR